MTQKVLDSCCQAQSKKCAVFFLALDAKSPCKVRPRGYSLAVCNFLTLETPRPAKVKSSVSSPSASILRLPICQASTYARTQALAVLPLVSIRRGAVPCLLSSVRVSPKPACFLLIKTPSSLLYGMRLQRLSAKLRKTICSLAFALTLLPIFLGKRSNLTARLSLTLSPTCSFTTIPKALRACLLSLLGICP